MQAYLSKKQKYDFFKAKEMIFSLPCENKAYDSAIY